MSKVIQEWSIPEHLHNIRRCIVTIEDGYIRLELSGEGFFASLERRKIKSERKSSVDIVKNRIAELKAESLDVTGLHNGSMDYFARIRECEEILDRLNEE